MGISTSIHCESHHVVARSLNALTTFLRPSTGPLLRFQTHHKNRNTLNTQWNRFSHSGITSVTVEISLPAVGNTSVNVGVSSVTVDCGKLIQWEHNQSLWESHQSLWESHQSRWKLFCKPLNHCATLLKLTSLFYAG